MSGLSTHHLTIGWIWTKSTIPWRGGNSVTTLVTRVLDQCVETSARDLSPTLGYLEGYLEDKVASICQIGVLGSIWGD